MTHTSSNHAPSNHITRRTFLAAGTIAGVGIATTGLLSGCDSSTPRSTGTGTAPVSGGANDVTYSANATSIKGDLTVYVTLSDSEITAVQVVDTADTPIIRDAAIDSITRRIVEQQNIEVDTVAGATMTSMAILSGVTEALKKAMDDLSPYQKGSDTPANKAVGSPEEFDLVVVGSGMAGLSAAVNAARDDSNLKILVLEKQAYLGGSSRVCGGGIWVVGSPTNKLIGQDSTKEEYINFMQKRSDPAPLNTALMSNIYEASSDAFTYLYSWGLPIYTAAWNLGNKESQLPCLSSTEAQRQGWETGESGFADFMAVLARNLGIDIRTNNKVVKLVSEGNKVTGIEVETLENTFTVNAKKIILASGGFTRNADLIAQYAPDFVSGFAFTGSGSTGDGIALTQELGATVIGSGMMGLYGVNPNLGYYGSIGNLVYCAQFSVNAEGEDMQLSTYFYADRLLLLCQQTNNRTYGIADASNGDVDRFEQGVEAGVIFKYETLEELAQDRGIDQAGLLALAAQYKVTQAPYYCVEQRPLFIGSIPGLKVGESCEVLNASDEPIENLYAVGELMFGNVFDKAYPASGTGIGTGCYTGAVAAKAVRTALGA